MKNILLFCVLVRISVPSVNAITNCEPPMFGTRSGGIGLQSVSDITARNDLDFIYQTIVANHPGMYNSADPNFKTNLHSFYFIAKQNLDKNSDLKAQESIITKFVQSFDDSHLGIYWYNTPTNNTTIPNYRRQLSMKNLTAEIIWITIPTLEFTSQQKIQFESINQELPKYRQNQTIVFDLRGNSGGNSRYAFQLLASLFGERYVNQVMCRADLNSYVDWRATSTNLHSIENKLSSNRNARELVMVKQGMESSILESKPYYREYPSQNCLNSKIDAQSNDKLIVIVDKYNYSATLDFIDYIKFIAPKSILIGQTTGADKLYNEISMSKLPSGLDSVVINYYCYNMALYFFS